MFKKHLKPLSERLSTFQKLVGKRRQNSKIPSYMSFEERVSNVSMGVQKCKKLNENTLDLGAQMKLFAYLPYGFL